MMSDPPGAPKSASHTVTTSCSFDCGARCLLRVEVAEGRVVRIGTERRGALPLSACARGLAQRDALYAPDRLTVPLRRRGPRGSGDFVPISWDEALDLAAEQLRRVRDTWGPEALFLLNYAGNEGALHDTMRTARRFFALLGGCTTVHGNTSLEGARLACRVTLGHEYTGGGVENLLHSKLIVLWGWNPKVTRFRPYTWDVLRQAREAGARFVSVDPRLSPSAEALGARWIPIRPGTDAAMLLAMAQVLYAADRYDRAFIERHCFGFERFADHLQGRVDGQPKDPEWAAAITGVPAEAIRALALDYADSAPAAIWTGWAPGRSASGEQFHRAALALSALGGSFGRLGGHVAGGVDRQPLGLLAETLPIPPHESRSVHVTQVWDALLEGRAGGFPSDLRLLYLVGSNALNQFPDTNRGKRALACPEFTVAHELFLTPTARWADLVLPVAHALEREDIGQPWIGAPYCIYLHRAVPPRPEVRSDLDIFAALAARLGLSGYDEETEEGWLRRFVAHSPGWPDFDTLRAEGVHRFPTEGVRLPFREQLEGGAPFATPSGRIELFSQALAERGDPRLPPLPSYRPAWEGPSDPLAARFPLQLVTPHARMRVNSQLDNLPQLKRQADDRLWLHPRDAAARGIGDGERVRVWNDRGALRTTAWVTERILAGVVSLDAGAWHRPDAAGVDDGGCVNVLTRAQASPGGASPFNTCLVEVAAEAGEGTAYGAS
jgi:anaerobic dimethyl sulfoxide reductase subunit A